MWRCPRYIPARASLMRILDQNSIDYEYPAQRIFLQADLGTLFGCLSFFLQNNIDV